MSSGITVAELVTRWGFDVDPKALNGLEKSLAGIQKFLGPVGTGILIVGAAATGIATGIAAMVTTTAAAGEEALKTAQKIGMHVERLQELQYAAKLADADQHELAIGLRFLSSKLYDASNGSKEAQKSFTALKLDGKKFKSADEALMAISDRFAAMPNDFKKTAMATDLFGRQGMSMIPMLNEGSGKIRAMSAEARRLGLVMSEQTARRSEVFMDTIKRLQSAFIGIKREIGGAFLPALSKLAEGFLKWVLANRELISLRVTEFIQAFGNTLTMLAPVLGRAVELGGLLFNMLNQLMQGAGGLTTVFKIMATALLSPFLIIDDIVAYFQGKDSLLGRFIKMAQEELPILAGKFVQFFSPVEGIIRSIAEQFRYIWRTVNDIIDLFKSPAAAFFKSLGSVWGMNQAFMGKGGAGGKAIDWLAQGLDPRGLLRTLNQAGAGQANYLRWMDPTMSPALAPVGAMAAGGLGSIGLRMGDIVVNVGAGANAAETGSAVGVAVKDSLGKALRQAQRDLKNTVVR